MDSITDITMWFCQKFMILKITESDFFIRGFN